MNGKRILVVEDEQSIREMIAFGLRRAGYTVDEAEDAERARVGLADTRPDIMLIDWMLPGASGLELTRAIKRDPDTAEVPIILLTARAEESDKITGLESGADDYITKPFSPRELEARIKAVLRRGGGSVSEDIIVAEDLTLDTVSHRITAGGRDVSLGPTEFKLLAFFMTHQERVYSRGQVLDRVWGGNIYVEERTVDVHITRLRKALRSSGCDKYVQTVRGTGYRFSTRKG